ncbi:dual specificity protein phosphatase 13-like isoform X2 [Sceloporus undulatus]|nr:dual specificity protein phosphatase 13-like isoform X2 [Sceloporus undulatus]XP_042315000.1 dual specificity protein phosphatase 13-like isoform X2 [Sceloporus undulatus]XP_042315001.1 dual specificity protein phosphatase 13-like isoform X2 [Sceloporus undulatus]XP_042315002.1 dual specificity protein phosphatase 13-like isoform X2 [Sceloporus undulatus]XP_042315003.1 dual specificity protein phosphatase 13-like isoform X2 [Sceloporus undulatus]
MSWDPLHSDDSRHSRLQRASSLTSSSQKGYETPELGELQRMLWTPIPCHANVNEVWPNLYIGDLYVARDIEKLRRMGITHIVNAAAGRFHINTGAKFYKDLPVDYYGVEADDDPKFDLSIYFHPTAKYIRAALHSPKGKVLVHCAMGISRSATLVLAFLMICENKTLVDALKTVREHRGICPNTGFISQLRDLDIRLTSERGRARADPLKL